jgi:hypothetical protein
VISFFFNKTGSGEIRGRQIGTYLGARLNPQEGYEDDVCIYVKMQPPVHYPKKSFVDVVDGCGLVGWCKEHPSCGVISTSLTGQRYLSEVLKKKVVFIPEHHCNFERELRPDRSVTTVGVIGVMKGFNLDPEETRLRFLKEGMNFVWTEDFTTRGDVIDFYRGIDIQICWRPHVKGMHAQLHNPLKLANAASFGIPTVSYGEDNYRAEFELCFFPVYTVDDLFRFTLELRDEPRLYKHLAEVGLKKAEEYHIEKVAKYYEELK